MTAEIAVLNKMAVTLAADSAVTLATGGFSKVYNSADKIFEATNFDPIGLMVYNSPEVHGIPIEAIVKQYRDRYCTKNYDNVFLFAEDFLKHLEGISSPEVTVDDNIIASLQSTAQLLLNLHKRATDEVVSSIDKLMSEDFTRDKFLELMDQKILESFDIEIAFLKKIPRQKWSKGITEAKVKESHGESFEYLIETNFDDVRLTDDIKERICKVFCLTLIKDYSTTRMTGLVFAGFGEKEIFPSLVSYEIYGIIAGKLKFKENIKFDVDRKLSPVATVIPFAQQEMVERFIYGSDGEFIGLCDNFFDSSLNALSSHLNPDDTTLSAEDADKVRAAIKGATAAIMKEFRDSLVPQSFAHR